MEHISSIFELIAYEFRSCKIAVTNLHVLKPETKVMVRGPGLIR